MVFVCLQDDISVLAPLRPGASHLRRQNIRTVGDLLNAPAESLSDYLKRVSQDLLDGTWQYAVPELGLPLPGTAGRVFWSLDGSGHLSIYGSGRVPDYTTTHRPPWEPLLDKIRSVSIEEQVTRLGALSFRSCPNLSQVTCESALRRIGTGAFRDCGALEIIETPLPLIPLRDLEVSDLPTHALRFGHYAFAGTPWARENLGEFFISRNRLLEYHGSDTHIRIPEGVTEIGPMAFERIPIETVEFPDSLLRIRDFAFRDTRLETLDLPDDLAWIGSRAFGDCEKLRLVNIRNRNMDAHPDAFAGTPLAHCGGKVHGRWRSRFDINCHPEAGMADFLRMQAGLSDEHPLGLKNFYPRTAFLNLLRQDKCLIRAELDPETRMLNRIVTYRLDRINGILWSDGWRDDLCHIITPEGYIDVSNHDRVHRNSDQLRNADIRGLTLSRKQYPFLWYCADNPGGNVSALVDRFLRQFLSAHPDCQLPPAE